MSVAYVNEKTWCNRDNQEFYNQVDLGRYASVKGLAGGTDVMLAQRFIPSEKSAVLEVGAGDGRVIEVLLENGYTNVAALERSSQIHSLPAKFASYLQSGSLRLCRSDLASFKTRLRFDTILWLFAGLTDFHPSEQKRIFQILSNTLKPNGKIVVDLPISAKTDLSKDRHFFMDFKNTRRMRYLPAMKQLVTYGTGANLRLTEAVPYVTETGMNRSLFVYTRIDRLSGI